MRAIQKGFTLIELMIVVCDHRHSGRSSTPGVPGLQQPGEDIRSDLAASACRTSIPRSIKVHQRAWRQQLGCEVTNAALGGARSTYQPLHGRQRQGHGDGTGLRPHHRYQRYGVTLVPLKAQAGGARPSDTTADVGGNTVSAGAVGINTVDLTTLNRSSCLAPAAVIVA